MSVGELVVIGSLKLKAAHKPTGKTRHYHGPRELPPPTLLKVVKYTDDDGYYLFYCDDSGAEFTDTYHDSLDEALAQAEWEFGARPGEWELHESSTVSAP